MSAQDGPPQAARAADPARPDELLDPTAIADTYMAVLKQPRSAWSLEVELRPWPSASRTGNWFGTQSIWC